ncbi:hypothetical protein TNCV_1882831 [Trichonephila clavipes]|nr:hypothetical protein TNCV_1882831 [Trichonephila clavipes]
MEDDSFRQESPVNTSRETFFFPEFDLNKFSSLKSFLECFDKQCLEYQKDEQWKKQNIPRYLTGVYLKFWYENHLFEKSYQEIKQLLMTVFDATKQEDIRRFHKLKLNDTKELISFFTENFRWGLKRKFKGEQKKTRPVTKVDKFIEEMNKHFSDLEDTELIID